VYFCSIFLIFGITLWFAAYVPDIRTDKLFLGHDFLWWERWYKVITGSCFLVIALFLTYFGIQMLSVEPRQIQRMLVINPQVVAVMNFVIATIFFTRTVNDFMRTFIKGFFNVPIKNSLDVPWYGFVLIIFWELLPTVLLLVTIYGTSTHKRRSGGKKYFTPNFGIFNELDDDRKKSSSALLFNSDSDNEEVNKNFTPKRKWREQRNVFDNRNRYDSDDDFTSQTGSMSAPYTPPLVPSKGGNLNSVVVGELVEARYSDVNMRGAAVP
jgi:hypothetical protein